MQGDDRGTRDVSAIILREVSKSFIVRHNPANDLKVRFLGVFHERHRERREVFWALRDINLEIEAGETFGLIGANGSGKSTLLSLIAGIFPPTRGEVSSRGRIAPMIELGVGFNAELTGRENVYLNASLYGLTRSEIDQIYPEVVAFSEIANFIDAPLKTYSSGMYMRLGFSIAVHLEPDILLVDEILAVGDGHFQGKCLARMAEMRKRGMTTVFVSHDLALVEGLCDRVAILHRGRVEDVGLPTGVLVAYRGLLAGYV